MFREFIEIYKTDAYREQRKAKWVQRPRMVQHARGKVKLTVKYESAISMHKGNHVKVVRCEDFLNRSQVMRNAEIRLRKRKIKSQT